jgi:hypothetical protein
MGPNKNTWGIIFKKKKKNQALGTTGSGDFSWVWTKQNKTTTFISFSDKHSDHIFCSFRSTLNIFLLILVESTPKLLFIAVMKKRLAGCNGEPLFCGLWGKSHF